MNKRLILWGIVLLLVVCMFISGAIYLSSTQPQRQAMDDLIASQEAGE